MATTADLAAVVGVGRATWPAAFAAVAGERYVQEGLARWWTPAALAPAIAAGQVLVADRAGLVVGMALFRPEGGVTVLDRLYVVPAEQGGGVGSALLRAVVARMPGRPLRLGVLAGNVDARAFYTRHGFRTLSRDADVSGGPDLLTLQRGT